MLSTVLHCANLQESKCLQHFLQRGYYTELLHTWSSAVPVHTNKKERKISLFSLVPTAKSKKLTRDEVLGFFKRKMPTPLSTYTYSTIWGNNKSITHSSHIFTEGLYVLKAIPVLAPSFTQQAWRVHLTIWTTYCVFVINTKMAKSAHYPFFFLVHIKINSQGTVYKIFHESPQT